MVSNDCKQTHFLRKNALVGEKSTAGPVWRILRQHRRRCLSSMCYHLLRCQAVISTSCNVDQQCTMMSSSSPSPHFTGRVSTQPKFEGEPGAGSQALALSSLLTLLHHTALGFKWERIVVQLAAVIKPLCSASAGPR